MHNTEFLRRRRHIPPEPADGSPGHRLRMDLVLFDDSGPVIQLSQPAGIQRRHLGKFIESQRERVHGGKLAQNAPLLRSNTLAAIGIQAAYVRAATDNFLHDTEGPPQPLGVFFQEQGFRHGHL